MYMVTSVGCARLSTVLVLAAGFGASVEEAMARDICWSAGPAQYADAFHTCVSSVLKPSRASNYGPRNLADVKSETAWCEGVRGAGIGETITMHIEGGPAFRRLIFRNGYGKSRKAYFDNNRVRAIEITTSEGIRVRKTLPDQVQDYPINLPRPAVHKWVRITILNVYPGHRYDDTCMDSVWPDFAYEDDVMNRRRKGGTESPYRPSSSLPVLPAPPRGSAQPPSSDMFGGELDDIK